VKDFVRDLTHAFRLIRRSPLFSFYVIAPLALGIGLNGAIFILLDAFLLRPLPVRNPAELVRLVRVIQNIGPRSYFSYEALQALQKKSTSFSDVIGYSDLNSAVRDSSGASRIRCQLVTGNFFTALGVQAVWPRSHAFGRSADCRFAAGGDRLFLLAARISRRSGRRGENHHTRRAAVHGGGNHAGALQWRGGGDHSRYSRAAKRGRIVLAGF